MKENQKFIFNEENIPLDNSKIKFISNKGTEFIVYKYYDKALKIYKPNYNLSHLSKEELIILKNIHSKRILLPTGILKDYQGKLIGYEMPFISNPKDILTSKTKDLYKELEIIKQDIDLLSNKNIILRDINPSNTIYNGKLYLIDPGNYLINNLNEITFNLKTDNLSLKEKEKIILKRNYNKINILINSLLFSHITDYYQHYQIIQFIMKIHYEQHIKYNLDILKMFFNPNLTINESINNFIANNIKENPQEKAYILSLYKK